LIQFKVFDTPEGLLETVPRTVRENIEYRMELHSFIAKDASLQKVFMELMFLKPQIYFDLVAWTYDPRKPRGMMNQPFILREAQAEAVDSLKEAIDTGDNRLIDKSREEGATELVCKLFALYWRCVPQVSFLVGSRKAEYVDKGTEVSKGMLTGDHKCLFHKILYAIIHWPKWMQPNFVKTFMHLENLDTSALIDGEATNENFGAGDRRTAVLVDEHGRIEHNMAAAIIDNLPDTTNCVIYNSTHFYGLGHPFSKLLSSGKVKVIVLPWERNPTKNEAMYRSPSYNEVEFADSYYFDRYPKVFNSYIKEFSNAN